MMPETTSAIATLGWVARAHGLASKTFRDNAVDFLVHHGAPAAAQRIFKAAIGAGSTTDSTLGQYGISIGQWSDSARTRSAFYRIVADGAFARVPMETRVGMVTSTASGSVVPEGKSIPVSRVTLNNLILQPTKCGALIVVTDTLLLDVGAGQSVFNRELLGVISDVVDTAFLDKIDNGLTPIASTGPLADMRAAMLAVTGGGLARPYWIASTDVGKLASTLGTTKGGSATAAASMVGGELANLPLLISGGCPAGTLYLIDAAQIAVDAVAPTVDVSSQADVLMDTAPSGMNSDVPSGSATLVSMFQSNSVALRATAIFGAEKLRATAAAIVTGISSTTWAAA